MGDSGTPFVLALPESVEIVRTYNELASKVRDEVDRLDLTAASEVDYEHAPDGGKIICTFEDGSKKFIDPYELRVKCFCAKCVDELSGRRLLNPDEIPRDVYPTSIQKKGNYAVAVVWSDGHNSSIYPFEKLKGDEIPGLDDVDDDEDSGYRQNR